MLRPHLLAKPLELAPLSELIFPPEVERQVLASWQTAVEQNPNLFDGPIVTVTEFQGHKLTLGGAMYRHLVAARRDQDLKRILALRPLAVSGVLGSPDGFVFGHRGAHVSEAPGFWELAPSGGVKAPAPGQQADLGRQILDELCEELGIKPERAQVGIPVGLIENLDTGVIDVVMPLRVLLSASDIEAAYHHEGSKEYDAIRIVADPLAFARDRADLLDISRAILREFPFCVAQQIE